MQLFTFYKKIDVMKDQRILLSKFGNILRNNSCTIAYKAAAKAQDLFKPENARLYRLFISSILASIELPPQERCQIVPLGQRYYALEGNTSQLIRDSVFPKGWSLVRIDLQVVPPGHVLLIVAVDHLRTLFTVADIHWQWRNTPKGQQNIPVVLAPLGN